MNYYNNIPNYPSPDFNPMMPNNNLPYKINELETRIKKLELRIARLENEKNNNNYSEPDTSMYMI